MVYLDNARLTMPWHNAVAQCCSPLALGMPLSQTASRRTGIRCRDGGPRTSRLSSLKKLAPRPFQGQIRRSHASRKKQWPRCFSRVSRVSDGGPWMNDRDGLGEDEHVVRVGRRSSGRQAKSGMAVRRESRCSPGRVYEFVCDCIQLPVPSRPGLTRRRRGAKSYHRAMVTRTMQGRERDACLRAGRLTGDGYESVCQCAWACQDDDNDTEASSAFSE